MSEQIYPGPSQMVQIDGAKVRSLREAKGLTQLYIATVVGVTTDTISRWENKRYPSIKEENARKLADALEASLEDILEKEETVIEPEETPASVTAYAGGSAKPSRTLIWLLLLVLVLLLPFVWLQFRQPEPVPEPVSIFARRILPPHIPAGQPFPVIIKVETKQAGPLSLILRENLPAGCEPIASAPPFNGIDRKTNSLKWIARTSGEITTFVYLARKPVSGSDISAYSPLHFSGSVTLRDKKSTGIPIAGSLVLPLADFHWADANRDNRIEDNEILAVYDTFSALDNIKYDWQEIDSIWSGEGYRWDGSKGKYIILQ